MLQGHEQHIVKNGAASQEMAQYINALISENEKKTLWIAIPTKESQAPEVLRQHQQGQVALAGMIKWMLNHQQPQQQHQLALQIETVHGPTVTEVDDDDDADRLNFLGGHNPNSGPPNGGMGQTTRKPPRASKREVAVKRH